VDRREYGSFGDCPVTNHWSSQKKEGPIRDRTRQQGAAGRRGPLTAREALSVVRPQVHNVGGSFFLSAVSSGEDIAPDGKSCVWRFLFYFPTRKALGIFELVPADAEETHPELTLEISISPSPGGGSGGPQLPLQFRDSPEAVRALAEDGADWVAGSTRMNLATRVDRSGKIVWFTESYGQEWETSFV
jgi:hypothetical protein